MKNTRNTIVVTSLCATALGAGALLAANVGAVPRSGSICVEETVYNPYHQDKDGNVVPGPDLPPFTGAKAACTAFHSNLGSTKVFDWWTYGGEVHAFDTTGAPGAPDKTPKWPTWEAQLEDTDVTLIVGHGNASTSAGYEFQGYYMYDRFQSKKTYLGATGRGLSVLSIWSCYTLTPSPVAQGGVLGGSFPPRTFDDAVYNDVRTRWYKAFRGGLRMITGTWHQQPVDGAATAARNYGTYLKTTAVAEAWRHANFDASGTSSAPAAYTFAADNASCVAKLSGMTLNNLTIYGRLKDAAWDASTGCLQWWS